MLVQTPEAINWTVVIKDYNRESIQIKLKHKNNTTGFKSCATARLVLSVQSWLKIDLDFIFQLGMWQQNGFVQTEKRDGWFLKPPTRVVFNVLLWLVVSSCAALPSWSGKSHCDTQKKNSPLFVCLPHSAARPKSRHPSTPAANITTSPPPAARGWGEKH